LQLKIFFKAFPETSKCPSCGKIGTIRRSRAKSFWESLIKASRIANMYKCRECGWRGIQKKYLVNKFSFITISFYSILIVLVAYIISQVLKRNFGY
jgi:predicted RNA-binding Zn-ribbon protein involved in translation (DUF1610 family)